MENSSKALLIAGTILIVILLISLGVYVFVTNGNALLSKTSNDQAEDKAFNSKLVNYEGNNISGTDVKQLIKDVKAINKEEILVTLTGITDSKNIRNNKKYTVKLSYDSSRVNEINIKEN